MLQASGDADECPTTFAEVMDKLRENDDDGCSGASSGLRSAVVSETAQVLGRNDSYRVVTTRECGDRSSHELLFSLFGMSVEGPTPPNAEVIAFDRDAGVFNYYTIEGGEWGFHGDSIDFIEGSEARCAECHTGGGLIMKELSAPWLHWEGDTTTPGADELIDNHEDLGGQTDGIEVEDIVRDGNSDWNETRAQHLLASGDLRRVLEPLFCTVEVNLDTAVSSSSTTPSRIPAKALVDTELASGSVEVTADIYKDAIAAANQRVMGFGGQLTDADGEPVVDTHFGFAFPERGHADRDYIEKLQDLGVIDRDFELDVLAVDLTNPLFSRTRCDLLDFVPDVGPLLVDAPEPSGGGDVGNCCEERSETGCSVAEIEEAVCDDDAFCCDVEWNRFCVEKVETVAGRSCEATVDAGNCCEARNDTGCENAEVEECVCGEDSFCCDVEWNAFCVEGVEELGCGTCGGGGSGSSGPRVPSDLAQRIREGFLENLADADADSPEGRFRVHLEDTGDQQAHREAAGDFLDACRERDKAEFMADALIVTSSRRKKATALSVFEFPATFARDSLNAPANATFDAETCELQ